MQLLTASRVAAAVAVAGLLFGSVSIFFVGSSRTHSESKPRPTVLPSIKASPSLTPMPTLSSRPAPIKKVKPSATPVSPSAKPSTTKPSSKPSTASPRPTPILKPSPKPSPQPSTVSPRPSPTTPKPTPTLPSPNPTNPISHAYNLVNNHRAAVGLRPLQVSGFLEASATQWTLHMANTGRMEHNNPLPRGVYGECIGRGYATASAMVTAWMNSPSHKAILLGNYTQIGIGFVSDGGWWTAQFA